MVYNVGCITIDNSSYGKAGFSFIFKITHNYYHYNYIWGDFVSEDDAEMINYEACDILYTDIFIEEG